MSEQPQGSAMAEKRGPCPHCGNDTYEHVWHKLKACQRCGKVFELRPVKEGEVQGG